MAISTVRNIRLYHRDELDCGETTFLNTDTSNHLIRVLRSKVGSPITLFNGDGFDYKCKTLDSNSKKTHISVESRIEINNESNLSITLIQGLSRNDRMDTTIQKSVELGVNRIIPVICQRTNIKSDKDKIDKDKIDKKLNHWRKIAISACEQSGRNSIPEISEVVYLNDINQYLIQDRLKIVLNPLAKTSLKGLDRQHSNAACISMELLVGPEGGLNEDEIIFLEKEKFSSVCFGPRILRTETAGPAVISALQVLWGDC